MVLKFTITLHLLSMHGWFRKVFQYCNRLCPGNGRAKNWTGWVIKKRWCKVPHISLFYSSKNTKTLQVNDIMTDVACIVYTIRGGNRA